MQQHPPVSAQYQFHCNCPTCLKNRSCLKKWKLCEKFFYLFLKLIVFQNKISLPRIAGSQRFIVEKQITVEALVKVLFCHSRGSNRESSFFKKQRLLDTRFHGYDGTGYFKGTFARASVNSLLYFFSKSINTAKSTFII
ncbi:hypothetical protein BMS3Abin06_01160 [bacterium BMS3Abin06]|nr:hypothetical protein BMS3Abin06_01160 [bacterium BMS3Abin06]